MPARSAKPASPTKSSLPALSKKVASPKVQKKALFAKPEAAKKIVADLVKGLPESAVAARQSVHAQVLLHGIASQIKQLGNKPISLVAKNIVSKGINLKPSSLQGVSKKRSATRKEVSKALNSEIIKYASVLPSQVAARKRVAAVKDAVNAEIVKKAVISQLKKKAAAKSSAKPNTIKVPSSPVKTPSKASPKKASPAKVSPESAKAPTTKSPVVKSPKPAKK
ncbi:hypothetical protein HK103_004795 [Boothiomyces macroporosus]|uniref:Uncharacterized protein n=1 Tax=Boothiomyces macroporosus TaxID=261099 RepID=A0AAD5UJ16_9FUNG|nr:hypothetical protein HK103_004795 [Boothiomyces macroporosus]